MRIMLLRHRLSAIRSLSPFDGEKELSECVEHLKQETRKYAKRQLTWFRKDSRISLISAGETTKYDEILKNAEKIIKKYSFF